ncbi:MULTISPECIES: hypothetical protein [unclassified Streptomyces]|uniref:hypothetical protein n=1 Tax=unclassified Streptomyces TaxID=2593676 RepID=UPI0033AA2911
MVTLSAPNAQDYVALAEIELCGELMIAASAAREERLSPDRIDEVLNVGDETPGDGDRAPQGAPQGADAGDRTSQEAGAPQEAAAPQGAGAPQEAGDGGLNATLAADACTTVPRQAANRQAAAHRQAAHQR